jgi:stage V sporulation protein B
MSSASDRLNYAEGNTPQKRSGTTRRPLRLTVISIAPHAAPRSVPDVSRGTSSRAGALAIGGAKAWFLIAGLAQNIVTPLAIGQEGFGTYKRALAFVNVLNNVVVIASIQTVSRSIAASNEDARGPTLRRAIVLHVCLGLALGAVFLAATPAIVAHQHAPQLAPLLRVLAVVVVIYGVYAPIVGALNGARSFGRQAALDATSSTLRTLLSALVGMWFVKQGIDSGNGALGAATGFLVTAMLMLPISASLATWRGAGTSTLDRRAHLAFFGTVAFAQLFQSLLLQSDLVLLGRFATLDLVGRGVADQAARAGADRLAGLYAQAQAFGLVPYQLLIAAAYVLFPAIASASARADDQALAQEIDRGGRATLLVAGALVAAIAGTPRSVLRFAFGRGGGDALSIDWAAPILRNLTLAHGCTAIAMVGVTLLAAAGRARRAAMLAAIVATCSILCAWACGRFLPGVLAPATASEPEALASIGTALSLGMLAGLALGAFIAAIVVARAIAPYVRPRSVLKVGLGVAVALGIGVLVPVPGVRVLCALPPLVPLVVYVVVVALLGEPVRALLVGARKPA